MRTGVVWEGWKSEYGIQHQLQERHRLVDSRAAHRCLSAYAEDGLGADPMTEMEEWVAWYASQGLTYFPLYGITNGECRCREGAACTNTGKHPRVKWKGVAPTMPKSVDNVGISTDDLVVVDFDADPGESVLNEFPRTFTTSTGHGFHLWYRADPSKPVKSVVGWRHKVDIRAKGGLVVAPPSRHKSGSTYSHVRGDSIQPVPRWLLDSLPEKGEMKRRVGYEVTKVNDETHQIYRRGIGDVLIHEMENWEVGRNQTLFRLGCRFYEFAADGILGSDVLRDLFDAAVRTGLSPDEVFRTLESARRSV